MTQIPSKRIEKLGKNLNAIVLFELMDISTFNKSKTTLARNLKHAINSISTNGKSESIKLDGTFFTENKIKVNIYARYNYGEYIELIFICDTSAALQKEYLENSESYVLKRNFEYEKMHREIESHIPPIMRGLHFNNELMAINKPFKLPALYIYNANIYLAHIQERKEEFNTIRLNPSPTYTIRGRAESFVDSFRKVWNKPETNSLNKIGIFPESLLGVIDSQALVSYDNVFFHFSNFDFPCKYVVLYFETIRLTDNDIFLNFIFELSLLFHIDIVFIELNILLNDIEIPIISGGSHELELNKQKLKAYSITANLDRLEDQLHKYYTNDVKDLEKGRNVFTDEETFTYDSGRLSKGYSISDHFKDRIIENKSDLNYSLSHKRERIRRNIESIQSELQLIKDKPVVNSYLKDIEDELEIQIRKWDGKIERQIIEDWILNFDSRADRRLALKILNKISYVTNKDLLSLCRALYNRIKPLCDVSTNYVFSYIGNLTGGSAHMLRPFQEENLISEKLFVDVQSISKSSERITLFLLDDFVGSGSTFVEWFQSNLSKKTNNNIEKTYYCVLTAFEKGIKHIKEQTNIQVICPQVYDKSSMVIDGDVFNSDEKQKIKSLLTKYSKRLPNQYLYGYDNCQLLVAFETNIPNNSISLLWASEYWSPLFKRK